MFARKPLLYDRQKQLIIRAVFSAVFLSFLMLKTFKSQIMVVLQPDECMRDYPFEWSAVINEWFASNLKANHIYLIYAGILMDLLYMSYMLLWLWKIGTGRLVFAMFLFYPFRGLVQNNLVFIAKPLGYLWSDPHFPSMAISYFPTNDFFYSGHIGSSTIFLSEYHSLGWKKLFGFGIFVMINEWLMLTVLRSHYVIDMICALIVARVTIKLGEKLTYYYDVRLMGLPIPKRESFFYKPCVLCGWNNDNAVLYCYKEEVAFQRDMWEGKYQTITGGVMRALKTESPFAEAHEAEGGTHEKSSEESRPSNSGEKDELRFSI